MRIWQPSWKSIWCCMILTFNLIISDIYFTTSIYTLCFIPLHLIPNMPCFIGAMFDVCFQIDPNLTDWRPSWKWFWPFMTLIFDRIISNFYFATFLYPLCLMTLHLISNMPCLTDVFLLIPIWLNGGHIGNWFDLVWPWPLI